VTAPICPDHGLPTVLVDDAAVYGRTYGRVWMCQTNGCTWRVGAHPNGLPKGTLANEAMRKARRRAHDAFDGWWKREGLKRGRAYRELADRMGVQVAHIGEMDESQCAQVVELFTAVGR
jgi:hypothetical protein